MKDRILVVEDDPVLGPMLRKILQKNGFKVSIVNDGRRALPALSSGSYDAAILDVMLPGIDGITVLHQLRSSERNGNLPVLLLTAKADDATTWTGWKAGADYFMSKPFDSGELVRVLRSIVG